LFLALNSWKVPHINWRGSHWLGDSIFPTQFTVKNVVCFSHIFHWNTWWNLEGFFTPFQLSFEFFTSNRKGGENVLGFPPSFSWKLMENKRDFSLRIQQKNLIFPPSVNFPVRGDTMSTKSVWKTSKMILRNFPRWFNETVTADVSNSLWVG
jgi:hypothetical protein